MMGRNVRWQAILGGMALLGFAMCLASPDHPNKEQEPRASMAKVARAQSVGVDPLRAQSHDPLRSTAASHTASSSGSAPSDPCRTHTDAEGNTEADCSVPLALNNPFR